MTLFPEIFYFKDFFHRTFLVPKFRTLFPKSFFSENFFGGYLKDKFQIIQYKTVLLIGNFLLFSNDPNLKASHELYRIKTRKISLFFCLSVTEKLRFKIEKQGCLIYFWSDESINGSIGNASSNVLTFTII